MERLRRQPQRHARRTVDLTDAKTSASSARGSRATSRRTTTTSTAVSTDNGANWKQVGAPIDSRFAWAQKSWDLSAYKGTSVQFRFRVATDGGVSSEDFIDDIAVTVDGVASGRRRRERCRLVDRQGLLDHRRHDDKQVQDVYYAGDRVYSGYDETLRPGPTTSLSTTKPDWVERFPYQNGMLVWFANGEYSNNNTSSHPGAGEVLPVDARPAPIYLDGNVRLGNRPSAVRRHLRPGGHRRGDLPPQRCPDGVVPSSPAIPTFDDSDPNRYWSCSTRGRPPRWPARARR